MNYGIIQPPKQIAEYVRFFWFSEAKASVEMPYVHNAFAYPCPELIFCYKGHFKYASKFEAERTLASGIYGQTESFSNVISQVDFGVFGIYLYPHCLPQLLGIPANEITNQFADPKALLGKDGEILEEKMMLAVDAGHRVKIISDFLISKLANARKEYRNVASTVKLITDAYQPATVQNLADNHFLSVRQFERRFKEFSGFSPKLFLRIARFNSVLNHKSRFKSLSKIAYEYGYHDQSHFIHDFQKFSGCNPKEYFRQGTIVASDRGTIEFDI